MPSDKRAARGGIAAIALGLSLAGPQAAGIAFAGPGDADGPGSVAGPQQSTSDDTRAQPSRPVHSGQKGGRAATAAAADPQETATAEPVLATPHPRAPRRQSGHQRSEARSNDSSPVAESDSTPAPLSAAAANAAEARSNVPAASVAAPRPAAAAAAVAPAGAVTAPAPANQPVLAKIFTAPVTPAAPRPPVSAAPIAQISTAVTAFFDSTANWLSGLPGGQLTQFMEGALLLVRRTFFNLFPALNAAQTTSQADGVYFTKDQLREYLLGMAKQQYGDLFGTTVPVYGHGPYPEYLKTDGSSDTNTQVDGVDEADFVETDGDYIYTAHNGRLSIVRTGDLSVASASSLTGEVAGQYLSGDRLTVITRTGSGWYGPQVKMAYPGYWAPWNPQTTITVYDVSDRTAPTVVNQTVFDGAYQDSRSVDGVVYVVMQRSVNVPAPRYTDVPVVYANSAVPVDDSAPEAKIRYDPGAPIAYRTYESWDQYVARVGDDIVDLSLPHVFSVDAQGNTVDLGLVASAGDIVRPHSSTDQAQQVMSVVSVNSATGALVDSVGDLVSADGGTVYMTPDALYVANTEGHYGDAGYRTDTRIERFSITGADLSWQDSGVVPGTLINQFAMDEKDGYLRVATHADGTDDNGVYVLNAAMDEVGRLTGLATGEQMYAVRYVGDTAYLVTFVRTDPLFAVDLSDPTAPALLGELEVPGFSNYLQSVGDGLLLGIGQEREAGNGNTHLHVTLFDVSDPTDMAAVDREFLDPGYQWSWSDAQFDHHAVLYSPEDGLLVVPVTGSGYDPETGYRSGEYLKVLRITKDGIEVAGEIHPAEPALRTVRIGDVLYAVGETTVRAYRLGDLSEIASSAAAPAVV